MSSDNNLNGKTAIITGAAMGLGRAIAVAYARQGVRLALFDHNEKALSGVVDDLRGDGGDVTPYLVDLRDFEATQAAAHKAIADLGALDVLVNNAGILVTRSIQAHTMKDWYDVIQTNLSAAFALSQVTFAHFKERGGGVMLFVSSASGIIGFLDETAYCASKHGLEGLMKCLAMEGEPHNIRANTVTPGRGMHTPLSEVHYTEEEKKVWVDPMMMTPAFVSLFDTTISGERLNAWEISERIRQEESA